MVYHKYTIHAYMHLERERERERESFYELLNKSKFKDSSWILRINEILVLFSRWFITIYKTRFQTIGFYRTYVDTEFKYFIVMSNTRWFRDTLWSLMHFEKRWIADSTNSLVNSYPLKWFWQYSNFSKRQSINSSSWTLSTSYSWSEIGNEVDW